MQLFALCSPLLIRSLSGQAEMLHEAVVQYVQIIIEDGYYGMHN